MSIVIFLIRNFREIHSLISELPKEKKQILPETHTSSISVKKKKNLQNLAAKITFLFHPAQNALGEFKSQDLLEVYSQNNSMPQCIYFYILPLFKGKKYISKIFLVRYDKVTKLKQGN